MVTGAGKVIIGQEFTASFAAYVTISDTGEEVILSIECPPEPAATFRYPRAFFANEDQIKQWASSVLRLFPDSWPLVVGFEAAQHISDLGFLLAGLLGNVPVNFDDVLKLHVKASADHLKLRFRQPRGRGRHSKSDVGRYQG